MQPIICFMGPARAGKDEGARHLVEKYRFVRIGLADPIKRFTKELFGFSDEQLYGNERDRPDERYDRSAGELNAAVLELLKIWNSGAVEARETWEGMLNDAFDRFTLDTPFKPNFLTTRYSQQTLGTEWGRHCFHNVWIDHGMRTAKTLLDGYHRYDVKTGLVRVEKDVGEYGGVVFSDFRFVNEFISARRHGAVLVRVRRPGAGGDLAGGIAGHPSEREQELIPDCAFDFIIENNGTLEEYRAKVDEVLKQVHYKAIVEKANEAIKL